MGGSWSVGPEAFRWSSVNSRAVHGRRLPPVRVVSRDKSSCSGCGTSLKARPSRCRPRRMARPGMRGRSYYDLAQFNDKTSVTTRPALPTHLSSPRKRGSSPANAKPRRCGRVSPAPQHFFQAFPNLACFCPSFSKHFFGGFVEFQGVTRFPNLNVRFPNFFPFSIRWNFRHAPRPPRSQVSEGRRGGHGSAVPPLSFYRKENR
jgi:hypothetical protein